MNELTEVSVNQQALSIEEQAKAVQITNNEQFESAAEMLKQIKAARKQVESYWKEPIQKAFEAHRALTAKKKAMTDLCDNAERMLKGKMLTYQQQLEAQRKAAEEEARKARRAEADKLLEQAAQAEQQGDAMAAEMAMAQADMVTQMTTKVEVAKPKVAGVSTRSKTIVKVVDDAKVPAYVNGFCIRKVDEKAILALHKLNPGLEIPGVVFEQEQILAVR